MSWRAAGLVAVGLGAAAFALANRALVPAVARSLRQASPMFVAAAVGLCIAGMVNQAGVHHAAQRATGLAPRFRETLRVATAAQFLNLVAKSGGMAGTAAFLGGRPQGARRSRVIVAYLLATVVGHASFAVVLGASVVMIWEDGKLTRADVIASFAFVAIMFGALTGLVAAMHSRQAFRRVHALPGRLAQRARVLVRRPDPRASVPASPADHAEADDLYDAVQVLVRRPGAAAPALGHAFGVEALGALLLWSVLRALGEHPAWSLAVVAYAVSVLFGVVGFLPGGLGFVEAGLGAVLVSYGVAGPVAAAAVVLYRLFELWIPVTVGAWAAQSLARSPSIA